MEDRLIIFDTTLRDGEQSPGASMTAEEKMRIARQLSHVLYQIDQVASPGNGDSAAR